MDVSLPTYIHTTSYLLGGLQRRRHADLITRLVDVHTHTQNVQSFFRGTKAFPGTGKKKSVCFYLCLLE